MKTATDYEWLVFEIDRLFCNGGSFSLHVMSDYGERTIVFQEHKYTTYTGEEYSFVAYGYPMTQDVAIIQESEDGNYIPSIKEIHDDIISCGLRIIRK